MADCHWLECHLLQCQLLKWDCCLFEYSSDLVCGEQIWFDFSLLLARFGYSWNVRSLTFCLWSENDSGDWTSDSDCWLPCCRTTKTRMKRRRMNDGAVFSSSCSDCHPHCQSADPCWLYRCHTHSIKVQKIHSFNMRQRCCKWVANR